MRTSLADSTAAQVLAGYPCRPMNERAISTPATQARLAAPIPVSALLAVWVNAWCSGAASGDDVMDAMSFANAQRIVVDEPSNRLAQQPQGLLLGLTQLGLHPGSGTAPGLRVVLPSAGDPRGLPGPKALNIAALDVGEIVVSDHLRLALLPKSVGSFSVWVSAQTEDGIAPTAVRPEQAPSAVRAALHEATLDLQSLDLTNSNSQVRADISKLAQTLDRTPLPRSLGAQDRQTIHSAATIMGICEFALADTPTQITAELERGRRTVISQLAATARHALAATCSAR